MATKINLWELITEVANSDSNPYAQTCRKMLAEAQAGAFCKKQEIYLAITDWYWHISVDSADGDGDRVDLIISNTSDIEINRTREKDGMREMRELRF